MVSHFKILYSTYFAKVYGTCLAILKNHELAEEIAQEAFISAYENSDTLKDASKFGAWVTSIATKKALNFYKRNKKMVPVANDEILDFLAKEGTVNEDPYLIIEKIGRSDELVKAIKRLQPPLNQVVFLKYYWCFTDKEISEVLDLPIGTVKSSLNRARKILMRILPAINKDYLSYLIDQGGGK